MERDNRASMLDELRVKLQAALIFRNTTARALALKAGLGETVVRDILKGMTSDVRLGTMQKLADALELPLINILPGWADQASIGPTIMVKGAVAAGVWKEVFEWPEEEWLAIPGRADIKASEQRRFGLRIEGDSMNLLYPEGSYVECLAVHSDRDVTTGKRVIVLRQRADGAVEATVKEFHEDARGERWLTPRSTNPAHNSFSVAQPGDGIVEIRILAVVVGSYRPE